MASRSSLSSYPNILDTIYINTNVSQPMQNPYSSSITKNCDHNFIGKNLCHSVALISMTNVLVEQFMHSDKSLTWKHQQNSVNVK